MSDKRAREDERRAAQGDVEAEARQLLDRLRTGTLDRERLKLAAYLGDPAAECAIGAVDVPSELGAWVEGLGAWNDMFALRAALVTAVPAVADWEQHYEDRRPVPHPREAIDFAREWLECPCSDHTIPVYNARQRAGARLRGQPPLQLDELEVLERAGEAGDEVAATRALVEQVRRGTLSPERVALDALVDGSIAERAMVVLEASVCRAAALISTGMHGGGPSPHFMGSSVVAASAVVGEARARVLIREALVPLALRAEECAPRRLGHAYVELVNDDLTRRRVDVIVNAANDQLRMQGGVAAALRSAGGPSIEKEAIAHATAPLGSVVRTGAGTLLAQHVYHAVVIRYSLVGGTRVSDVRAAVRAIFEEAEVNRVNSIALPLFGAGVGGLSVHESLETILDAIEVFSPMRRGLRVEVVVLDAGEFDEACAAWRAFLPKKQREEASESAADDYLRRLSEGGGFRAGDGSEPPKGES